MTTTARAELFCGDDYTGTFLHADDGWYVAVKQLRESDRDTCIGLFVLGGKAAEYALANSMTIIPSRLEKAAMPQLDEEEAIALRTGIQLRQVFEVMLGSGKTEVTL